jgi:hypothetical protein
MLIPNNIHPENTIYYNSAFVLKSLQDKGSSDFIDLYQDVKNKKNISFSLFVLCLDWLFLTNIAELNDKGVVNLCS